MKKAVVWGFRSCRGDIIKALKNEGVCEIVEWFGRNKDCTYQFGDIIKCNITISEYKPYDKAIYDAVFEHYFKYFTMHNRKNQVFYKKEKFYDYLDFFNIYFQFFYNILTSKKVDVLIASHLPHIGPDLILYLTAKALNMKTILFYQSIFENKYLYVHDLEDFGTFNCMKPVFEEKPFPIEKKFNKDLFYMNESKKKSFFGLKIPSKYFMRKTIFWYLFRFFSYSRYVKDLNRIITKDFDLDTNFVYFPLHLQPELSTATIGDIYNDQVLALERLSELIPDNWYIYVKENPKQTEYQRGKAFFKRLKAIKNLKLLPMDTSTYLLTEKCKFVATITGTAAWEAITGGKNSLVFGDPWYKKLPGVFEYSPELNINDILNYTINHTELEQAVASLMSKMPEGIINKDYLPSVKNYDHEENTRKIVDFIKQIL